MLDRIYSSLKEKNPELMARKRYKLKPPQIMRIGTRKCMGELSKSARLSSVSRTTYTNILSQNLVQLDQQMEQGA